MNFSLIRENNMQTNSSFNPNYSFLSTPVDQIAPCNSIFNYEKSPKQSEYPFFIGNEDQMENKQEYEFLYQQTSSSNTGLFNNNNNNLHQEQLSFPKQKLSAKEKVEQRKISRKIQKTNYLDVENKKQQQILKNRASAQLSRDKKKQEFEDLEKKVKAQEKQIHELTKKNKELEQNLQSNICIKCQSSESTSYFTSNQTNSNHRYSYSQNENQIRSNEINQNSTYQQYSLQESTNNSSYSENEYQRCPNQTQYANFFNQQIIHTSIVILLCLCLGITQINSNQQEVQTIQGISFVNKDNAKNNNQISFKQQDQNEFMNSQLHISFIRSNLDPLSQKNLVNEQSQQRNMTNKTCNIESLYFEDRLDICKVPQFHGFNQSQNVNSFIQFGNEFYLNQPQKRERYLHLSCEVIKSFSFEIPSLIQD